MQQRHKNISVALKKALQKLLTQIMTPQQISLHNKQLQQLKKYNKLQHGQLVQQHPQLAQNKQNMHNQHSQQDNSSNSDFDENYKNLDRKQMKYLIRKKLVNAKLANQVLEEITLYDSQLEKKLMEEQQQFDSLIDINDNQSLYLINEAEKMLNQANQVYIQDLRGHKNLKALKFIIEELQNQVKNNKTCIK